MTSEKLKLSERDERSYCVYKHISPSGKIYIGMTCQPPENRWMNGHGYAGNDYFSKAIQKYGWGAFNHEIVCSNLSKEQAEQLEVKLIAKYKSNQRANRSGTNHPMYGTHLSKVARKHLSDINTGTNHPQFGTHRSYETKRKISEAQKGKIIPAEQRKKISKSLKGNIPPNRRTIRCVETGKVFPSLAEACEKNHITNIWKALNDSTRTAAGFHWEYVREGDVVV